MKFIFTGFVALLLGLGSPARAATEACFLQVDGKTYLNRPCSVEYDADGSLRMGFGTDRSFKFFAYVVPEENAGTATGWWNGSDGWDKAQTALGTLELRDGCWVNEHAKVCAGTRATPASQEGARQSAERFVRSLYEPYFHDHISDLGDARASPHAADRILAPSLISLRKRSSSKKSDEVGPADDGDPICSCQEAEISNLNFRVISANDKNAVVVASFKLGVGSRVVTFDLSFINNQWRIADIKSDAGSKSFRQSLLADVNATR